MLGRDTYRIQIDDCDSALATDSIRRSSHAPSVQRLTVNRGASPPALVLKPGRDKSLKRHHPWVFSGAVARLEGDARPGDTIAVLASDQTFLAQAAYSPRSQIVARVWSFAPSEPIDTAFFEARLKTSIAWRASILDPSVSDAARLVHAESDGLPGLIVDRYANTLVVQFLAAASERWRNELTTLLARLTGCACIYERSDVEVRELEGFEPRKGPLVGDAPTTPIIIREHDIQYRVDVVNGQKTGFYLDQRANRRRLMELAENRKTLNAFCYTGAFSLAALRGGAASVLSIDSSAEALHLAQDNLALNSLPAERARWLEADVFKALRDLRDRGERFDMIILDPPKFAPTAALADKAARAYKDINLLAFKLLQANGLLVTFSCSGGIGVELFQKIVASAAADAGIEAQIIERLGAAPDHPVSIHFPEAEYLKGLILRRIG